MKIIGKLLKILLWVLALPLLFILVSLTLTYIPAGNQHKDCNRTERIYLNSTLIHTDIVLPLEAIDSGLRNGLYLKEGEKYVAFGWGDKKFYLETPTWNDLKTINVLIALFTFSESMMHIERYEQPGEEWIELMICKDQLNYLNQYIERKFGKDLNGEKVLVRKDGYHEHDSFYKAKGPFSIFFTCNSWVNEGMKFIGEPACLWTPYNFGVSRNYQD